MWHVYVIVLVTEIQLHPLYTITKFSSCATELLFFTTIPLNHKNSTVAIITTTKVTCLHKGKAFCLQTLPTSLQVLFLQESLGTKCA